MLNIIWLGLIVLAAVIGVINGKSTEVVAAVTTSAKSAFEIALGLVGVLTFWLGLMKIAEESGLINKFARLLRPLMVRLFPEVPAEHPAMGAMVLNMSANMLGLNNAATPFGLRAMAELATLNKVPGVASNAMCTFLAINTSSLQIIPTTAIAYLAAAGSQQPTIVLVPALMATTVSTVVAILVVKILEKLPRFRLPAETAP